MYNEQISVLQIDWVLDSNITVPADDAFYSLMMHFNDTHFVVKEEDATEQAEEVSSEQREVDCCSTSQLYHHRHQAVQCVHTRDKGYKQQSWGEYNEWTLVRKGGANQLQIIHCD